MVRFYAVVSCLMGDFSQTINLVRFTVIQMRKCNKINNFYINYNFYFIFYYKGK